MQTSLADYTCLAYSISIWPTPPTHSNWLHDIWTATTRLRVERPLAKSFFDNILHGKWLTINFPYSTYKSLPKFIDCQNTDCRKSNCQNTDCRMGNCQNTDCQMSNCQNTDCCNTDCQYTDCQISNCQNTDCPNAV